MSGVTWQRGPAELERAMLDYIARIERATAAAATRLAAILEADAKTSAPWQDRTGAARRDLFAASEVARDLVTIYLSHGANVPYGLWLEIRHGERFAIIWPTISAHMNEIWRLIREELGQ